jgi:hypothetical protein
MPQRGVQHTTMTDQVRVALCQYNKDNPKVTQKELGAWLEKEHNTKVAQSIETFWMQQSNTKDYFMTTLQRMRDDVRAIRTRQMVQKGIQSYFT